MRQSEKLRRFGQRPRRSDNDSRVLPLRHRYHFTPSSRAHCNWDGINRDAVRVHALAVPGNEATTGHLTGEFHRMVTGARVSVTCATYNFSPSSNMWGALRTASDQPGLTVVVYVDAEKGDPLGVKAKLPKAG